MSGNLRGAAWMVASCAAVIIVSSVYIAEREARRGLGGAQM